MCIVQSRAQSLIIDQRTTTILLSILFLLWFPRHIFFFFRNAAREALKIGIFLEYFLNNGAGDGGFWYS